MRGHRVLLAAVLTSCAMVAMSAGPSVGPASAVTAPGTTWDTQAQFTTGATLNNTVATAVDDGEVRLSDETTAFPFIWVALSNRGTIAKIDTVTGTVLGEYRSAPQTVPYPDPSRTTVAKDGSVWSGNRQIAAVVHIGVSETEQCVDRNGNGVIDTSHGYGDVKDWPADGVANAADECILNYVPTYGGDARHVSVDAAGDIWVGNFTGWPHRFNRINPSTGTIVQTADMLCGGYGGLVDRSGVIWSSTAGNAQLLRWDPTAATTPDNPTCISVYVYGVAEDSKGNIWVSNYENDNNVRRISPDGKTIDAFPMQRGGRAQGLAISQDSSGTDHVWVSSALNGGPNVIAHLLGDGTWVGNVTGAGAGSTGVAVDAAGKIWTANYASSDATRIDPNSGPTGTNGIMVGAFDKTVPLPATSGLPPANPYNYSDMTGSSLKGAPDSGTWTGVYDSGATDANWGTLSWNANVPAGASMTVRVAASNDSAPFGAGTLVTNGTPFTETGRYVTVTVVMNRAPGGQASGSPVLNDLTLLPASAPTTLTTSLSGGSQTGGTITVPAGTAVTDSATLTGTNAATATGTINYNLYSDAACATLVTAAGGGSVVNGTVPNSSAQPMSTPGVYYWTAAYSGDTVNQPSSSTCGSETVTVTAVNHPPTAEDKSVSTPQDTPVAITLTGTDPDGDPLTFAVVSDPAHGTLSGTAPNLTYTPTAEYSGPDSFTYKANDRKADSAPAAVSITVTPVTTGCRATAPTVDVTVSADQKTAAAKLTSGKVTTTGSNRLVLAFVEADGPTSPTQKVTGVTGGGLTWTLAARSNATWGTTEVWQAHPTTPLTNAVVTAKLASAYDGSITVTAFTGAANKVGATATGAGTTGQPTAKLTPVGCNSLVWAAGHDWTHNTPAVADTGQTLVHQFVDTRVHDSFWTQKVDTPTTIGTDVTVKDTVPTKDRWTLATVEIPPAS